MFGLCINPATYVLGEVEHGEQQERLRPSASEAIYVAMAEVNTAPRKDGRAVAIKPTKLDDIILLRSVMVPRLFAFCKRPSFFIQFGVIEAQIQLAIIEVVGHIRRLVD